MNTKGIIAAILTSMAWGATGIWVHFLNQYPYQQIIQGRFFLAFASSMILFLPLLNKRLIFELKKTINWKMGIIMAGYYTVVTYAFHVSSVTEVALCVSTSPLFVLIYNISKKIRLSKYELWGGLLTLLGVYVILFGKLDQRSTLIASTNLLGNALALAGALLTAIYAIYYKGAGAPKGAPNTLAVTLIALFSGSLIFSISSLFQNNGIILGYHPKDYGYLAGLAFISTLFPILSYSIASSFLPALQVTLIRTLTPLLAALYALIFLQESISVNVCFGGILSFAGIYMILFHQQQAA